MESGSVILCKIGKNASTQTAMIRVVTMEDTAIEIVDITYTSSLAGSTSALSIALKATGNFKLIILPVTKPR